MYPFYPDRDQKQTPLLPSVVIFLVMMENRLWGYWFQIKCMMPSKKECHHLSANRLWFFFFSIVFLQERYLIDSTRLLRDSFFRLSAWLQIYFRFLFFVP